MKLFSLSIQDPAQQKAAVTSWIYQSMQYAWPAGSGVPDKPFNPASGTSTAAAKIDQNFAGKWALTANNWDSENFWIRAFYALFAAPAGQDERGITAGQDLSIASPGIGLKLIILQDRGDKTQAFLGAFSRPDSLYLFDPKNGLLRAPSKDPSGWFQTHLKKHYPKHQNSDFYVQTVLPETHSTWYPKDALEKTYRREAKRWVKEDISKLGPIVDDIADKLKTGHVALGEAHGTPYAKAVLVALLKKYADRIQAIFLEQIPGKGMLIPRDMLLGALIGAQGFGDSMLVELAQEIKEAGKHTNFYAFDPIYNYGVSGQPSKTILIPINEQRPNVKIPCVYVSTSHEPSQLANLSSQGQTIRNWNMAKAFTHVAGDRGCIVLNGSDHLIPNPDSKKQIKHRADYLPALCGIQHVFALSSIIDRSKQSADPSAAYWNLSKGQI